VQFEKILLNVDKKGQKMMNQNWRLVITRECVEDSTRPDAPQIMYLTRPCYTFKNNQIMAEFDLN